MFLPCIYKPNSVSRLVVGMIAICLGPKSPMGSSDSSATCVGTRSCTRVSILLRRLKLRVGGLDLHRPRFTPTKGIRHCSQLSPCGGQALPATFNPSIALGAACSDFPLRHWVRVAIRYKAYLIIL